MIGYACINERLSSFKIRGLRKSNVTTDKLMEVINHNLHVLDRVLTDNIKHQIKVFRISSDLIPFGSDVTVNDLDWPQLFKAQFSHLAKLIKQHDLQLSMHPGQYTVLNSPDPEIVKRSIADLVYHDRLMTALELDRRHKLVLHVGGVYGDKPAAIARFVATYQQLPDTVKARLIIENDDRLYTISDVLAISAQTGAPVVYDNLHNACNPGPEEKTDREWILEAMSTWQPHDGLVKVHYSQQRAHARLGAHTSTIYLSEFLNFYHQIKDLPIKIMLEVKDKNLSATKCLLATQPQFQKMVFLEKEWAAYKYLVLYYSPKHYQAIRALLKDKQNFPVQAFYQLLEDCLETPPLPRYQVNAIDHIWGYFKKKASPKEKSRYLAYKDDLQAGKIKARRLLNWLYQLALKYDQPYLKSSLIFHYRPHD